MSRNPHRAGWAVVLTGILESAAASADCRGIEVTTYDAGPDGQLELIETRCHSGSAGFLPWIDTGIESWVDPGVDRTLPEAARRTAPRSRRGVEIRAIERSGAPPERYQPE